MSYRVVIDTETGGTRPVRDFSLLSLAIFVVTDEGKIVSSYGSFVAPEGGEYHCTEKALEINGIDLEWHRTVAQPIDQVRQEIVNFIEPYRAENGGPLEAIGWNVMFDYDYVAEHVLGYELAGTLFGYRSRDLHAAMALLADAGIMPYTKSLEATSQFFGLLNGSEKQEHSALADARLTVKVYRSMLKLLGHIVHP